MNKFIFLTVSILSAMAYAKEGSVGNGGDAVVCYESDQKQTVVKPIELFDYWEQSRAGATGGKMEFGSEPGVLNQIDFILNRLSILDPVRAKLYRSRAKYMLEHLDSYIARDYELSDLGKNVGLIKPNAPCYQERFAVQTTLKSQRKFTIIGRIYDDKNTSDSVRAGLILHEIILEEAISNQSKLDENNQYALTEEQIYPRVHHLNYLLALKAGEVELKTYRMALQDLNLPIVETYINDQIFKVVDQSGAVVAQLVAKAEGFFSQGKYAGKYAELGIEVKMTDGSRVTPPAGTPKDRVIPADACQWASNCYFHVSIKKDLRYYMNMSELGWIRITVALMSPKGEVTNVVLNTQVDASQYGNDFFFSRAYWNWEPNGEDLLQASKETMDKIYQARTNVYDPTTGQLAFSISGATYEGSQLHTGFVKIELDEKKAKGQQAQLKDFIAKNKLGPNTLLTNSCDQFCFVAAGNTPSLWMNQYYSGNGARYYLPHWQFVVYKFDPQGKLVQTFEIEKSSVNEPGFRGYWGFSTLENLFVKKN